MMFVFPPITPSLFPRVYGKDDVRIPHHRLNWASLDEALFEHAKNHTSPLKTRAKFMRMLKNIDCICINEEEVLFFQSEYDKLVESVLVDFLAGWVREQMSFEGMVIVADMIDVHLHERERIDPFICSLPHRVPCLDEASYLDDAVVMKHCTIMCRVDIAHAFDEKISSLGHLKGEDWDWYYEYDDETQTKGGFAFKRIEDAALFKMMHG